MRTVLCRLLVARSGEPFNGAGFAERRGPDVLSAILTVSCGFRQDTPAQARFDPEQQSGSCGFCRCRLRFDKGNASRPASMPIGSIEETKQGIGIRQASSQTLSVVRNCTTRGLVNAESERQDHPRPDELWLVRVHE